MLTGEKDQFEGARIDFLRITPKPAEPFSGYDDTFVDLSNDYLNPTALTLEEGSNVIIGSTKGAAGTATDPDFFTFEVPTGFIVSAIELLDYQWGNGVQTGVANYGNSYFALTSGSAFSSITSITIAETFLVNKLIDDRTTDGQASEVGQDILEPGIGLTGFNQPNPPGPGQLGPGTYSVWYQETAADTTYEFDIQLEALPADAFKFEAEDLTLDTYLIEDSVFASGGKLTSLKDSGGNSGSISTTFSGNTDTYYAVVRYVDETDGTSTLDFKVNGTSIEAWTLNKDLGSPNLKEQAFAERVIGGIELSSGDLISIEGTKDRNEETRVDSIQLVPADQFFLFEAEDMLLGTYLVEDNAFASGDKLISLMDASGNSGTASTDFFGPTGTYDITVGYVDESDGVAQLEFLVDGTSMDSWLLDKDLGNGNPLEQTFIEREIKGVSLTNGSTMTLMGDLDSTEWARVDFLRVTPAISPT